MIMRWIWRLSDQAPKVIGGKRYVLAVVTSWLALAAVGLFHALEYLDAPSWVYFNLGMFFGSFEVMLICSDRVNVDPREKSRPGSIDFVWYPNDQSGI